MSLDIDQFKSRNDASVLKEFVLTVILLDKLYQPFI